MFIVTLLKPAFPSPHACCDWSGLVFYIKARFPRVWLNVFLYPQLIKLDFSVPEKKKTLHGQGKVRKKLHFEAKSRKIEIT